MIKRQKIEDREELTNSQKEALWAKSGGRCCHCGRRVYFGYGATVEHVVPIIKGGTNDWDNLVMLCRECNEAKKSRVYAPANYLPYLGEDHLRKANEYFREFTRSFEYVSRGNLLSVDEYDIGLVPEGMEAMQHNPKINRRMRNMERLFPRYYFMRAYPEDLPRVKAFFREYLRKRGELDSEESADMNVEFWSRFGSIYYVEGKKGDIRLMCTFTASDMREDAGPGIPEMKGISMHLFAASANRLSMGLARLVADMMPNTIIEEQGMSGMLVRLTTVRSSPESKWFPSGEDNPYDLALMPRLQSRYYIISPRDGDRPEDLLKEEESRRFFGSFHDVRRGMDKFFSGEWESSFRWMGEEIITGYETGVERTQMGAN